MHGILVECASLLNLNSGDYARLYHPNSTRYRNNERPNENIRLFYAHRLGLYNRLTIYIILHVDLNRILGGAKIGMQW
jgi:hypothetical protein